MLYNAQKMLNLFHDCTAMSSKARLRIIKRERIRFPIAPVQE